MPDELAPAIHRAAAEAGLTLPHGSVEQLARYLALLARWNDTYNLSAVREPEAMVTRHIVDSLSITPWLPSGSVLDIGTGPGLPGLVIAITEPQRPVVLLDSSAKKARFNRQAVIELGLPNVTVRQARADEGVPESPFNAVVARAFGSLAALWDVALPMLVVGGEVLAMKGQYPTGELAALPTEGLSCSVERLAVPGIDGERHLVRLVRASYQRRPRLSHEPYYCRCESERGRG